MTCNTAQTFVNNKSISWEHHYEWTRTWLQFNPKCHTRTIPKIKHGLNACIVVGVMLQHWILGDEYRHAQGAFIVNLCILMALSWAASFFSHRHDHLAGWQTIKVSAKHSLCLRRYHLIIAVVLIVRVSAYPWFGTPDDVIVPGSHKDVTFHWIFSCTAICRFKPLWTFDLSYASVYVLIWALLLKKKQI